jgi:hypothetical protein
MIQHHNDQRILYHALSEILSVELHEQYKTQFLNLYRELLTYQTNLSGLFDIENTKNEPQKERQQEEK